MSPQKKTVHISASRTVTFGAVAKERLRQENDRNYLVAGKGVIAVDRRRWQTAQEFEYRTWMIDGQHVRDDRNRYHRAAFDNYTALASRSFKRGIELGCGPFTNIRHILRYCRVAELHLLDPLLHHYLHHPHRKYTKAGLRVWQRNRGISLPRRQPVVFHNTSIEEFKPASPNQCDLIVMINVLEHCMNAKRVFATIQSLAAPGAFFVFADKYYSATRLPSERLCCITS
ncbi:MAG: hypothetical protein COT71_02550 [Candidatus Andersenbacteria bacterium CG10_big_fil_rev_8_21_14_0_10_54_11]|uniref:Methyltransferase type 12 domain-containing protein n=1 Tax=Candidatus Andersenbacteria bacterium CG10_big_fil_rev_8_21_14_0_10_54_11 TaxID=1974485 RepID=A0A2M6WZB5_9BACT|nr:MAG: hypothetical protein COT71_02550 [Candidatus Andersenbacteria bacterium CG10_big_fil_rev_8_21_14_0_10_54_11]